jgi:hypothetical protein
LSKNHLENKFLLIGLQTSHFSKYLEQLSKVIFKVKATPSCPNQEEGILEAWQSSQVQQRELEEF